MDWTNIDWRTLERLRTTFLAGTAGASDYWQSETDLASYDATFAQRIGWKWDYVLAELQRRGWSPPRGELLDWGCGSGIAGRAFLDFFGADSVSALRLWDRSPLATQFAAKRAGQKYPGLQVSTGLVEQPALLLISHVLTELTPEQSQTLADFAAQALAVIWVEPGTYETSLTLIAIRERLRDGLRVVAPCTHQARCGILAPENERHWCHHFAAPPPEVFQDGGWARFAKVLGVDLRDLPLSFLVLDRRPAPALPMRAARVIGHPRVYKPHALLLGCDESGVSERRLTKRAFPDVFKRLKKGECDPLQVWRCMGDEIAEIQPLGAPPTRGPGHGTGQQNSVAGATKL
jgi:hypothetical protein